MRYHELPQELRQTRKIGHQEEDLQVTLIEHIKWRIQPDIVYFAVPNGGKRSKATAAKLKAMGVRAGVHDLVFFMPGPQIFTLELKHDRNKMSPEQTQFALDVEKVGGSWAAAWTLDDALTILEAVGIIKPEAT